MRSPSKNSIQEQAAGGRRLVFVETNASGSGLEAVAMARDLGYEPVFCAADPDYFARLPGGELLDDITVVTCDTYSANDMGAKLHEHQVVAGGVIALDDYHLLPASQLAAALGLPGQEPQGLLNTRRKDLTRRVLDGAGVTQPRWWTVEDLASPLPAIDAFPVVVKPVDDSGSVGVTFCADQPSCRQAIAAVLERSTNVRGFELTRLCLIEQVVEGPEFSAEFLHDGNDWRFLGFTDKIIAEGPTPVERGHAFPVQVTSDDDRLAAEIARWLLVVGLDRGAAHVEFKVTPEGPVPIEINPRLAGGRISNLIEAATGINAIEALLHQAMGTQIGPTNPSDACTPWWQPNGRSACVSAVEFLIPSRDGLILEITGLEGVAELPGVIASGTATTLPRTVGPVRSNYDLLAYVLTVGCDLREARERASSAREQLGLVYADCT